MHEVRNADHGMVGPQVMIDEQAPPTQRAAEG
jgi:hypothetical protein